MQENRNNIIVLAIFGLALVACLYFTTQIRFNYDFEAFFPHDNEHLDFYTSFRDKFEPDDNYILIAIENANGTIFDHAFLNRVDSFTHRANHLPHIEKALSLTTLKKPVYAANNPYPVPFLDINRPERYSKDSIKIMQDPRVRSRFISDDARSISIVLTTSTVLNLEESQAITSAIDSLIEKFEFEDAHIAGRSIYQAHFVKKAEEEFFTYSLVSLVIVLFFLILIFRRFWGVAIALTSVFSGMVLFMGYIGYFGIDLDPMSILFSTLMIIVGMSDVIHIMSKYIDELKKGFAKKEAIRKTIREIGLATLLTSTTTALGFASLFTSNIPPIRNFGIHAAIGVFLAYIAAMIFTTSSLTLFSADQIIKRNQKKGKWGMVMQRLYLITRQHPKRIGVIGIASLILCLIGISQISTDVHIENNFPRKDKIRSDFVFFEENFGGVRNYELAVMAQENYHILDYAVMQELDTLEDYLNGKGALRSIISPITAYKSLNQGFHLDNPDYYSLPESAERIEKYTKDLDRAPSSYLDVASSKDRKFGRLSAKIYDIGSDSAKVLRQEINEWISRNIDSTVIQFQHTGSAFLFDKNSDYVRGSLFSGLALAFIIVSLLMALLFKNLKMVLISLVPNIFPLLVCGAIIGFAGIELDAPTSIIFAIAFGIAVDDTIHFLSKFKLEVNKGHSNVEAVRTTFLETGKALSLTTLILFTGFIILVTSTYPPTLYIGLLVSLTLVSALVADLFLAPIMIYWLLGYHNRLEVKSFVRKKILRLKVEE